MQWALIAILIVAVAFAFLSGCTKSSLFHPTKGWAATPGDVGLAYENVYLDSGSKNIHKRIHGWYIPATDARGTVLAFHGNAGNISHRVETLAFFHSLGVNVFMIDYQGYGKSEGAPGEQATYDDADAAWKYLVDVKKAKPGEIIVFGRSLGGAVAIYLAAKHPDAAGLVVESAFTSVRDMAGEIVPIPGLKYLVWNYYPSLGRIKSIKLPTMVIHAKDDNLIPFDMGRELFKASGSGDKTFLEINGGHNGAWAKSIDIYKPAVKKFLDKVLCP